MVDVGAIEPNLAKLSSVFFEAYVSELNVSVYYFFVEFVPGVEGCELFLGGFAFDLWGIDPV